MKPQPTCETHPHVTLRCPACIGQRGGQATSPRKARAARRNAKRPRAKKQAA
jgi:hypothetical protein